MRLHTLTKMLQFKRPMGSRTEQNFRKYFLHSLKDSWEDDLGNIHILIARKDRKWPKIVWSSHTDTVHTKDGLQRIHLAQGMISLAAGETSNCLGADCTVGVWLMREMILARIPGHYVFHWGEEKGCVGSSKVVKAHPEYFKRAKAIIAFDRKGDDEVITHQRGKRMCSDTFANSVAAMLPIKYAPSQDGVYTDSAEYAQLIPECTNLGVGYHHEHSSHEMLDLKVPVLLLTSILKYWDEDNVIIERDPLAPVEYKKGREPMTYMGHGGGHWAGYNKHGDDKKPQYTLWENGQLVQISTESTKYADWLRKRDEDDDFRLHRMGVQ